VQVQ
jgi:hypothetical protein